MCILKQCSVALFGYFFVLARLVICFVKKQGEESVELGDRSTRHTYIYFKFGNFENNTIIYNGKYYKYYLNFKVSTK